MRRLRSSLVARAYVGLTGRASQARIRLVVAAAVGVLLLLISPLLYQPITPEQAGDGATCGSSADRFPELFGSSLLFWVLVPLGCVVLYLLVARAGPWSLPAVYLACFLLAALPVRLGLPEVLRPVRAARARAAGAPAADLRTRWDYAGIGVMYVAFAAYALSFAG